jgi:hypothetical protein
MTMYLPNNELRPVGAEIDEFVDAPLLSNLTPEDDAVDPIVADDDKSA